MDVLLPANSVFNGTAMVTLLLVSSDSYVTLARDNINLTLLNDKSEFILCIIQEPFCPLYIVNRRTVNIIWEIHIKLD